MKFNKTKCECDFFDKVRWIALKDNPYCANITNRDEDFISYIAQEQYRLEIDDIYGLNFANANELEYVIRILDAHKENVIELFFLGSLSKDKVFSNLNYLEYYMFSLFSFLSKKQLDDYYIGKIFNGNKIYHHERTEHRGESIYKFTDIALSYHKLFYIVSVFCVTNDKIKPLISSPNHLIKCIKESLDIKEIKVWHYRP